MSTEIERRGSTRRCMDLEHHNGSVCFKTATCMESNHLGIDALHNGPHEPLVKGGEWGIVQAPIQQIIVGGVAIPSRSSQR